MVRYDCEWIRRAEDGRTEQPTGTGRGGSAQVFSAMAEETERKFCHNYLNKTELKDRLQARLYLNLKVFDTVTVDGMQNRSQDQAVFPPSLSCKVPGSAFGVRVVMVRYHAEIQAEKPP